MGRCIEFCTLVTTSILWIFNAEFVQWVPRYYIRVTGKCAPQYKDVGTETHVVMNLDAGLVCLFGTNLY